MATSTFIKKTSWVLLLALVLVSVSPVTPAHSGSIPVTQGISLDPEYVSYPQPSASTQILSSGLAEPSAPTYASAPAVPAVIASGTEPIRPELANQPIASIYVPGAFSFPVVQQPSGQWGYVSTDPGAVTQFSLAAQYGTIGLLAHNNMAGSSFYDIAINDIAIVTFQNGSTQWYRIKSIKQYQALQPYSPYSNFIDLEHPGVELSTQDVFSAIYQGSNGLVFQTCLAKDGNPSWGRVFITATPVRSITSTLGVLGYSLMSLLIY